MRAGRTNRGAPRIACGLVITLERLRQGITVAELAVEGGLAASRNEARRLAAAGGLKLDGRPVIDLGEKLEVGATDWRIPVGRKHHIWVQLQESATVGELGRTGKADARRG